MTIGSKQYYEYDMIYNLCMDHAKIINISTKMERESKFPMLPPNELELIRH